MSTFKKLVSLWILIFIIGCGGGENKTTELTTNLPNIKDVSAYQGKNIAATVTDKNLIKFSRALHLLETLDIDSQLDNHEEVGKTIQNNFNGKTGKIIYTYDHYKLCCSDNFISGVVELIITDYNSDKNTAKQTINIKNITIHTIDNNITFSLSVSGVLDYNKNNLNEPKLEYSDFYIYDSKHNEHIWAKDFKFWTVLEDQIYQDYSKGRVYVSSEGYIDVETKGTGENYQYTISGKNNIPVNFKYTSKKEILISGKNIDKVFYTMGYQVSAYKIPLFDISYIKLGNTLDDTNLTVIYSADEGYPVHYIWYVNNKKIKDANTSTLSRKYFKKNDRVKAIIYTKNEDNTISSDSREEFIQDAKPIVDFRHQPFSQYAISIDNGSADGREFQTNTLEFVLDDFVIMDPDGDPIEQITWTKYSSDYNPYSSDIEIINDTEHLVQPTIKIKKYGKYILTVTIVYQSVEYEKSFLIKFKPDIFEQHKVFYGDKSSYTSYNSYYVGNSIGIGDLNHDGLKDIAVYSYSHKHKAMELFILYQQQNGSFVDKLVYSIPALFNDLELVKVADINNDGLDDIVLSYTINKNCGFTILNQEQNSSLSLPQNYPAPNALDITQIEVTDFDSDGEKDIILLSQTKNFTSNYPETLIYPYFFFQKNGIFSKPEHLITKQFRKYDTKQMLINDLNNDGRKDLLFYENQSKIISYIQNENNQLIYQDNVVNIDKNSISSFTLIDNNQKKELLTAKYILSSSDYVENQTSLFSKPNAVENKKNIDNTFSIKQILVGDINGDNENDIVLVGFYARILLSGGNPYNSYYNYFTDDMPYHPDLQIAMSDLNNDQKDDIVIIGHNDNIVNIYLSKF